MNGSVLDEEIAGARTCVATAITVGGRVLVSNRGVFR